MVMRVKHPPARFPQRQRDTWSDRRTLQDRFNDWADRWFATLCVIAALAGCMVGLYFWLPMFALSLIR